jgi:hypothetical protein
MKKMSSVVKVESLKVVGCLLVLASGQLKAENSSGMRVA